MRTVTIRIVKQVVFRDNEGTVLKTHEVGEELQATVGALHFYGTPMGGIFLHEAVIVNPAE